MGSSRDTRASTIKEEEHPSKAMKQDEGITRLLSVYDGLQHSSTVDPSYGLRAKRGGESAAAAEATTKSSVSTVKKRKVEASPKSAKCTFTWTEDMQRLFLASIFDIGLKNAKPKLILSSMRDKPDEITTEHIKSHLQKYRSNARKHRENFFKQFSVKNKRESYNGANPVAHSTPAEPNAAEQLNALSPSSPKYRLHHGTPTGARSRSPHKAPAAYSNHQTPETKFASGRVSDVFGQMEIQMKIHQQIQEHHDLQRHRHESSLPMPGNLPDHSFPGYRGLGGQLENDDFDDLFDFLQ